MWTGRSGEGTPSTPLCREPGEAYPGTKLPAEGDQCTGPQSTRLLPPPLASAPRPLPWLLETWLQSPGQAVSRGKKKPNCKRNSQTSLPPMALPGSLLPVKEKWQQRSQVFRVGYGSRSTSSSSSSSSSTRPTEGVPGRPPREAPGAGHEGPRCPGAGAAASEEDAAWGARELLAAVGERNCIHRRVPLARGLFPWARESVRAGASSGCSLGEGNEGAGEGASRPEAGEGRGPGAAGSSCSSDGPSASPDRSGLLQSQKQRGHSSCEAGGGRGNFPPASAARAERLKRLCGATSCASELPSCALSPSPRWRRHRPAEQTLPARPRLRRASASRTASPASLRPHLVPQALCSPFRGSSVQRFRASQLPTRLPPTSLHFSRQRGASAVGKRTGSGTSLAVADQPDHSSARVAQTCPVGREPQLCGRLRC